MSPSRPRIAGTLLQLWNYQYLKIEFFFSFTSFDRFESLPSFNFLHFPPQDLAPHTTRLSVPKSPNPFDICILCRLCLHLRSNTTSAWSPVLPAGAVHIWPSSQGESSDWGLRPEPETMTGSPQLRPGISWILSNKLQWDQCTQDNSEASNPKMSFILFNP